MGKVMHQPTGIAVLHTKSLSIIIMADWSLLDAAADT